MLIENKFDLEKFIRTMSKNALRDFCYREDIKLDNFHLKTMRHEAVKQLSERYNYK